MQAFLGRPLVIYW